MGDFPSCHMEAAGFHSFWVPSCPSAMKHKQKASSCQFGCSWLITVETPGDRDSLGLMGVARC